MSSKSFSRSAEARRRQALQLRARYDAGTTVSELVDSTGLAHGTVLNRLQEARTSMRTPRETRQLRADKAQVAARRRLAIRLRARYEAGATISELAAPGRSARTVRRLLSEAGTTMRSSDQTRRLRTPPATRAAHRRLVTTLRTRYEAGALVPDLAADYGRSESTIYRWLHQANTKMRPRRQSGPARRAEKPS